MTTAQKPLSAPSSAPFILRGAKATAFTLIGDRCHNDDYIRTGLARTIGRNTSCLDRLLRRDQRVKRETLAGRKLLIILRDGMTWPDGYPDEATNAGLGEQGEPGSSWCRRRCPSPTPSLVLGSRRPGRRGYRSSPSAAEASCPCTTSTYIAPYNQDFRDVLGAVTEGHPPIRTFKVKVKNTDPSDHEQHERLHRDRRATLHEI